MIAKQLGDSLPALVGMLGSIPVNGWTLERRGEFLRAFESVLDYTVPIIAMTAQQLTLRDAKGV